MSTFIEVVEWVWVSSMPSRSMEKDALRFKTGSVFGSTELESLPDRRRKTLLDTCSGALHIRAFGLVVELDLVVTANVAEGRSAGAFAGGTVHGLGRGGFFQRFAESQIERGVLSIIEFQVVTAGLETGNLHSAGEGEFITVVGFGAADVVGSIDAGCGLRREEQWQGTTCEEYVFHRDRGWVMS